jgi:hypothetical protein
MCSRGRLRGTPHWVRVPLNGLQLVTIEQGTFLTREEWGHFYRGSTAPLRHLDYQAALTYTSSIPKASFSPVLARASRGSTVT